METRIRLRLDAARGLYRRGKYHDALKVYDTLEKFERPEVYEGRALAGLKADQPKEAVRDARSLVRLRARDAKSWLLLGRTLEQLSEYRKAAEVYRKGLEHVAPRTAGGKLLETARMKIVERIGRREGRDPFQILPTELLAEILDYLDIKERVYLSRVSKCWRTGLRAMPWLYKHMDFVCVKKPVKLDTFKEFINLAQGRLVQMRLGNLPENAAVSVYRHIRQQSLKQLKHVEIYCSLRPSQDLFKTFSDRSCRVESLICGDECSINEYEVWSLILSSRSLKRVEMHEVVPSWTEPTISLDTLADEEDYPPIEQLQLVSKSKWRIVGGEDLSLNVQWLRKLKSLVLQEYNQTNDEIPDKVDLTMLTDLRYCFVNCFHIVIVPPSVTGVKIDNQCIENRNHYNFDESEGLSALSSIEIDGTHGWNETDDESFWQMLEHTRHHLERFSVQERAWDTDHITALSLEQGWFDQIQSLELAHTDLENDFFISVAERCHDLTELLIPNASKITGIAVKALVNKSGKRLKYLDLTDCDRIQRDAIELARSRGIVVSFGSSNPYPGGKKVRHG